VLESWPDERGGFGHSGGEHRFGGFATEFQGRRR
jgi:hypothetical protein